MEYTTDLDRIVDELRARGLGADIVTLSRIHVYGPPGVHTLLVLGFDSGKWFVTKPAHPAFRANIYAAVSAAGAPIRTGDLQWYEWYQQLWPDCLAAAPSVDTVNQVTHGVGKSVWYKLVCPNADPRRLEARDRHRHVTYFASRPDFRRFRQDPETGKERCTLCGAVAVRV